MKIDLTKIINGSNYKIDLDEKLDVKEFNSKKNNITFNKPVEIKGGIYNTDDGMFLDAKVIYEYKDKCDRCLKEITVDGDTHINSEIKLHDNKNEENEVIIAEKDKTVDLYKPVISSILLSMPMKTLCDENCSGICPKCGMDLNNGQCDCEDDNIDPRLAKLKELMDK